MDYCKLNQVANPIAAAVPAVVSLLKQINTSPGTWYVTVDLFFSPSLSIGLNRSSFLSASKASNTTSLSYLRSISTL